MSQFFNCSCLTFEVLFGDVPIVKKYCGPVSLEELSSNLFDATTQEGKADHSNLMGLAWRGDVLASMGVPLWDSIISRAS